MMIFNLFREEKVPRQWQIHGEVKHWNGKYLLPPPDENFEEIPIITTILMNMIIINDDEKELHSDAEGAKLGMWIFIFTEMLLFGGLFIVYSIMRSRISC